MNKNIKPNHLYLICAITIVLVILNGFIEFDSGIIDVFLTIASFVMSTFWIIYLINDSKFRKTIFGRITYLFLAVIIIGLLFKIQHWASAGTTLKIGYVGIMINYAIRFITKKQKNLLDILKLLWVESTALISLLSLMHKIESEYSIINTLLFIALICAFTLEYNKKVNAIR